MTDTRPNPAPPPTSPLRTIGPARLHVHRRGNISLAELLADLQEHVLTGYVTTASDCELVTLRDGGALAPNGNAADLAGVFEARLFPLDESQTDIDVKWLNDAAGRGNARMLSETIDSLDAWTSRTVEAVDRIDGGTYQLWGSIHSKTGQVVTLDNHRIGNYAMELPAGLTDAAEYPNRVLIKTVEYLTETGPHGNIGVEWERLAGLTIQKGAEQ